MKVKFTPSHASGEICALPSKSFLHRALICASLADGESIINNVVLSDDVKATVNCLVSLGAEINVVDNRAYVKGAGNNKRLLSSQLFCNESGSTLRFLVPVSLLLSEKSLFICGNSLLKRPCFDFENIFNNKDVVFNTADNGCFVSGKLENGKYLVSGDISSQFVTGLLLSLPLVQGDSEIILTSDLKSKPYIDITRSVCEQFGVSSLNNDYKSFFIKGGQIYKPCEITVECDYSNAAYIVAYNCFGGNVKVNGLSDSSLQGDYKYKEYFDVLKSGDHFIDVSDCPDLAPVLTVVAAINHGCTLTGTSSLKYKESDRATAMKTELSKFGIQVNVSDNSIEVFKSKIKTPEVDLQSHNDHRVVMALSLLCSYYGGTINGFEAVNKSYPTYLDEIKKLGIKAEEE